ncbi:hypothetical protein [Leifsonia sp. NPDC080035]|uniref:Uncharacterized protein n=1 Tax=Leifsonia sp. NPDC080035 TaxID=3143936 RepID=A0AAU7GD73_9MICO
MSCLSYPAGVADGAADRWMGCSRRGGGTTARRHGRTMARGWPTARRRADASGGAPESGRAGSPEQVQGYLTPAMTTPTTSRRPEGGDEMS